MCRVKLLSLILLALLVNSLSSFIYPCTTFIFRYQNHIYLGRNLDWISGTGLIMTNQRNLEKTALLDSAYKPAVWISRFGSVTLNQVGKDLPFGGINEAGLVVEHMSLGETIYPEMDERNAVQACQWIQYQLDNCETVEDVIKSEKYIRIVDKNSKFHFLICDRFGHSAGIEFLDGKMKCYTGKDFKIEAMANSTYDESILCFKNYKITGDTSQVQTNRSLYNFVTASQMINSANETINGAPVDYAFKILNAVSQGIFTKWSIIYDITDMKVYLKIFETPAIEGTNKIFRRTPGSAKVKIVNVKEFDFDCGLSGKVLDLDSENEGVVNSQFVNYTTEINKQFITKAFTFYKNWGGTAHELNEEQMNGLSQYPETFKCK